MTTPLQYTAIGLEAWTTHTDPATGAALPGQAAVRYLRFDRQEREEALQISPKVIRWIPDGYGLPAHVLVQVQEDGGDWRTIAEATPAPFPPPPAAPAPIEIPLGDVLVDHLRVISDLEYPTPPAHGQQWAAERIVPYQVLDNLTLLGSPTDDSRYEPRWQPMLQQGAIAPSVPSGMAVETTPAEVRYSSPGFTVSFSLSRPVLRHLGLDAAGTGLSNTNLLTADRHLSMGSMVPIDSGPQLVDRLSSNGPTTWTGAVTVQGATVAYHDVHIDDGVSLDLVFTVQADGLTLDWAARCTRPVHAWECEIWRLVWDGSIVPTGTWGLPEMAPGRTGVVPLPARFAAPGYGTLAVTHTGGDPLRLQVDSVRPSSLGWAGFQLPCRRDAFGALTVEPGAYAGRVEMRVEPVVPAGVPAGDLPAGLLRNWHTAFGFRPEHGGVSNNAMSVNCHVSQAPPTDVAAFTAAVSAGPHPIELCRWTIDLALRDGPGYGGNRHLYMDSDPNLIAAAGRIHQVAPDPAWLHGAWPYLQRALATILDAIDDSGLMCCHRLSGNRGSGNWSSNAWDVVSFGHYDAYANAWGYRALRCAAALARDAGDPTTAAQCTAAADRLLKAYCPTFLNPDTGWLGGWRSADGELHDYAFTFVNAQAVCYGLVPEDTVRSLIAALEAHRKARGLRHFHYGLPANLDPLPPDEVPAVQRGRRADGWDTYGVYLNASLTPCFNLFYLRMLSQYGFTETADRLCDDLLMSFERNVFSKGLYSGTEFFTWEGRPCGYEGVLVGIYPVLLAIAWHKGWVAPSDPLWWPA